MAKVPVKKAAAKKTPAKKAAKTRKAAATAPVADEAAPVAKKVAKPRKAAAPKAPVDTRVTSMHGETRMTHHGDGAEALAAVIPMIDAVHAGAKVAITSAAHGAGGVHLHVVAPGHPVPFETHPGIILTVGPNGLMTFDHVAVGLATPDNLEAVALATLGAIRPDEGGEATPSGRHPDWFARAVDAAEAAGSRAGL